MLKSNTTKLFLAKFWGPLLCVYGAVAIFGRDFPSWRSLITMAPLLILAAFGASAAMLEVRNGSLRYRRFLKWKTIPREQVIGAAVVWGPVLASLRLHKKVLPWGKLYFVLDGNVARPSGEREYPLLDYIGDYKQANSRGYKTAKRLTTESLLPHQKLIFALTAGVFVNVLFRLLQHFGPHSPGVVKNHALVLFARFEVQLVLFLFIVLVAIWRRSKEDGWIAAFLAGMGLPGIAIHWLSSIQ